MEISKKMYDVRRLIFTECETNKWQFWNSHLAVVERIAQELVREQGANLEITMLGVYLHDIGKMRGINDEEHESAGVPIAEEIMRQFGYDEQTVQKVDDLILSHPCGQRKPRTLEEKILATADAMSHFTGDFYLRLFWEHPPEKKIEEQVQLCLQKVEKDFHDKIFFESARVKIRPAYEAFKFVFSNFAVNTGEGTRVGFEGAGVGHSKGRHTQRKPM